MIGSDRSARHFLPKDLFGLAASLCTPFLPLNLRNDRSRKSGELDLLAAWTLVRTDLTCALSGCNLSVPKEGRKHTDAIFRFRPYITRQVVRDALISTIVFQLTQ